MLSKQNKAVSLSLAFGAQDRTDNKNTRKKWPLDSEFYQNMLVL